MKMVNPLAASNTTAGATRPGNQPFPDAVFLPTFAAASQLPGRCPPASPRLFYLEMTMTPKALILDFIAALALFTILGGLPLILWGLVQ